MALFNFIDLFAGIGGFRAACERLNGKCIAFAERSNTAVTIYSQNFIKTSNLGDVQDITIIKSEKPIDLITAGIPCQPWSVAGKKGGFKDPRGRLWMKTIDIIKNNRPKSFIIENVKGLTNQNNKDYLQQIYDQIKNIGYFIKVFELSSINYGLVQDRKRVFIVGFKDVKHLDLFKIPTINKKRPSISDFLYPQMNLPVTNQEFDQNFRFADVRGGDLTFHTWDLIDLTKEEKLFCETLFSIRRKAGKALYKKDGASLSIVDINKYTSIRFKKQTIESLMKKGIIKKDISNRYDFKNSRYNVGIRIKYSLNSKKFEINNSYPNLYRIYTLSSKEFPTITKMSQADYICTKIITNSRSIKAYKNKFLKNILIKNMYRLPNTGDKLVFQGFPRSFQGGDVSNYCFQQHIGNAVPPPVVESIVKEIIKTKVFD